MATGLYPDAPDVVSAGDRSRLLTLPHLLSLVHDYGRPVEIAVETKHPTRYGSLVERSLVETLDRFGWAHPEPGRPSPVRVMSFSLLAVRRMRMLAPRLPLVMLMERVRLPFRDGTLPRGVTAAGVDVRLLRTHPTYVERAHVLGHEVHAWTVDAAADVRLCVELGVDVLLTDDPRIVLAALGRDPGEDDGRRPPRGRRAGRG